MPSFNRTRIDRDAETNGAWMDYTKIPGVELLLCRFGHPKHMELLKQISAERIEEVRAQHKLIEDGKSHDATGVLRQINAEAAARELCKGWRGITESDEKGSEEVPYTWEACYDFLMDEELPFYDDVLEMTMREQRFRKEAVEKSRGKSQGSSSGSSSGTEPSETADSGNE